MDFGFNFTPPDPEKLEASLRTVKDAFQRAADANTGKAQPMFQTLSDKFNEVMDKSFELSAENIEPMKAIMKLMPSIMEVQMTFSQLRREAENNSAAADALADLQQTIQAESKSLLGSLGLPGGLSGFPGFPGNDDDTPPAPPAPKEKPAAPKFPRPKKPGNGDFKL